MRRQSWIASALALLLCASSAHAGNVFIVDAAHPPGTQPDIQSAINLSTDGDAIVVRSGTYTAFDLPDRELSIVGDIGAVVNVRGAPRLNVLSASRTLFLAGLQVIGGGAGTIRSDGLDLSNAAGSVRIEDCAFVGVESPSLSQYCLPRHGAFLQTCADVAFTRCTLRGSGPSSRGRGGDGLRATASNVALYDCAVQGGHGNPAGGCEFFDTEQVNCVYGYPLLQEDGADGGAGCTVTNGGSLMLSGSTVLGGDGGDVSIPGFFFLVGGCGGHAVKTTGVASIWKLESATVGGQGAPGSPTPSQYDGRPGQPIFPNPALLTAFVGTARSFVAPRIVREGQPLHVRLDGVPGDRAVVLLDLDPARVPSLPFRGWYLVHPPPGARFVRLGMLDASGALDRDLVAPMLAPGELARTLFLQTIHGETSNGSTLGPAQAVVVVDSSL